MPVVGVGEPPSTESLVVVGEPYIETNVTIEDDDDQGIPSPGRQGDPGPPWTDRGDWQPDTDYPALSVVHYGGSTYGTPIDRPGVPVFNPDSWSLWASKGDKGDKGNKGDQGIPGTGTYDRTTFVFDEPSTVWRAEHNKGLRLPVTITDSTGRILALVDVRYIDENVVEAHFGAPTSGKLEI